MTKKYMEALLAVSISLWTTCLAQSAFQEFYPFGNSSGDRALERADDAFQSIPIAFDFPFFGSTYRIVHITTNGIINFGSGTSDYTPERFPLNNFKCIAAYWTDSDPRNGGDIFYREVTNSETLDRISNDIRSKFVEHRSFRSTWALIITYDSVSQFGCGGSTSCSKPCNDTLIYQFIITSDGMNSFAIFIYNKLLYTSGTAGCDAHAQIGFNAGDGKRFYLVPSSNTENISSVALTTSNVGQPGKWMFSVDGSDIQEGCNDHGELDISQRKLLYFSRESITLSGPCFNEVRGNISVTFDGNIDVGCEIINGQQIHCVAPFFSRIGWTEITLTYRNTLYVTYIDVVDIDDNIVVDNDWMVNSVSDINGEIQITWNSSLFRNETNSTIEIRGVQVDSDVTDSNDVVNSLASKGIKPTDTNYVVDFPSNPNTGSAIIRPVVSATGDRKLIRRMMLTIFSKGIPGVRIVATIFLLTPAVCSFHCDSWHRNQPSESEIMSITETASRRSPCQPSVPVTFPALLPNFEADKSCNPNNPRLCNFFHPGASSCYRSTNNFGSEVVQCCYDRNGGLLLGPPGGGTLDFADSKVSVQDHFWKDVLPYITCCKCSDKCSKYYEKRPSVNSRWFGVPRPGGGGGDPHFLTLDGTEYTFNPVGEFVYLATDLDVIQVRMSQFIDAQGVPKQGSYFSAFIFRYDNMDTVQIELNNLKMFNIFVNGESLSLGYGVWRFRGVSLNYINRTAVEVYMASGLTAEIHIQGRVLNIVILFPLSAKGKVKGLAGNWDDNQDNDLQTSSGTWIPSNSTSLEIHNIFGMSWSTTNSTSLFTYPTGLSWQDFQLPGFIPDHSQPPENPRCNGNAQCNYDAYVTGDIEVGLANIDRQRRLADLESSYSELSTRCPQNVSVNNGKVSSTKYNDTYVKFTVTCNDGYKLSGKAEIICREGRYDPIPVCNAQVPTTSSASYGLSGSLFGLAAILVLHGLLTGLAND